MQRAAIGFGTAAGILLLASSASAQTHSTNTSSAGPTIAADSAAGPPIEVVPIAEGESIGHRIARARELMSQVEFGQVIALVRPVRLATNLPTQVRTEAVMLEVNALIGLDSTPAAIDVCRTAVALSDYNPDVAHNQSPPVRQACHLAAERARTDLVQSRGIRIGTVRVVPGAVAWTAVRVEAEISGDVTGLEPRAEVTVGTNAPVRLNLQPAQPGHFAVAIDANEASPDTVIHAVVVVGDSYGVLASGASEASGRVPRDEAAVRFALGSDEGPLQIDGRATGSNVVVGHVLPIPLGTHTLSVQTASGGTSTSQVTLHRGEVALLTLHTIAVVSARSIVKWGTTIGAVLLGVAGAVFQSQATAERQQLASLAMQRESRTNQPTVVYGTVQSVDDGSRRDQTLAIAAFGTAGLFAVVAAVSWLLPSNEGTEQSHTPRGPTVSIGPQSAAVSFQF